MPSTTRRLFAPVALLVLIVALVAACGSPNAADSTSPQALRGAVRDDPLDAGSVTLPEVTGGQDPQPFTVSANPGELLVMYFGYTSCPDVCPTTLAALKTARAGLGDDAARLDLAMVTVDPERDTPERLTEYLDHFADRRHALRTTDAAELEAAEEVFGASSSVTTSAEGEVEVSHTGTAYVVDEHGDVVVEWPFGMSADDMAHDLRILFGGGSDAA